MKVFDERRNVSKKLTVTRNVHKLKMIFKFCIFICKAKTIQMLYFCGYNKPLEIFEFKLVVTNTQFITCVLQPRN